MKKELKNVECYEFLRDEFYNMGLVRLNNRLKRFQKSSIQNLSDNKFEIKAEIDQSVFTCIVMEFLDEYLDMLLSENEVIIKRLNVREDKENG